MHNLILYNIRRDTYLLQYYEDIIQFFFNKFANLFKKLCKKFHSPRYEEVVIGRGENNNALNFGF